jgi:hypothetical protein
VANAASAAIILIDFYRGTRFAHSIISILPIFHWIIEVLGLGTLKAFSENIMILERFYCL